MSVCICVCVCLCLCVSVCLCVCLAKHAQQQQQQQQQRETDLRKRYSRDARSTRCSSLRSARGRTSSTPRATSALFSTSLRWAMSVILAHKSPSQHTHSTGDKHGRHEWQGSVLVTHTYTYNTQPNPAQHNTTQHNTPLALVLCVLQANVSVFEKHQEPKRLFNGNERSPLRGQLQPHKSEEQLQLVANNPFHQHSAC